MEPMKIGSLLESIEGCSAELRLTVRDRILIHLQEQATHENLYWVPFEVTQPGIANGVRIARRHVPQYDRPMIASGLVSQKSAYVKRRKQHRKVYFPTPKGRAEADGLIRSLFNELARAVGKEIGPKGGIAK